MSVNQIDNQRTKLETACLHALNLAHSNSNAVEVSINKVTGIEISTRYGEIDKIKFKNDGALYITVYNKHCKGSASSTDLRPEAIARTVEAAREIAQYTSPDPASGPAEKSLLALEALPDLNIFHPTNLNLEYVVTLAAESEQAALNNDKRILHTEGGNFNSYFSTRVFGNSYGMLKSYNSTHYSLSCSVIAVSEGQMERDYAYTLGRAIDDLRSPCTVGEECAHRTIARINSRKLPTMEEVPVLFSSEVAAGLFEHLASAISGRNVYRKSTFLLNDLGKMILPKWFSINERPHMPKGLSSSPFDNEGVKTCDRIIIKDGILNTWLLDSYAARKLDLKSTGHAGGICNWIVSSHQNMNFSELLKIMKRGLVVTELMGQGVNIITGDYSRGAAGFWVENGEIAYPVSEITIAGNLKKMLSNIVGIGKDIDTRSSIHCGSILLSEMCISGQEKAMM